VECLIQQRRWGLIETRVHGFSLGGYAYGEGDRLTLFFSREKGKVRLAVKGARKSGSKLFVLTELFNESELSITRRPGAEVYRLLQGRLLDSRPKLKERLASLTALQVLADILRTALPDDEPQPDLYVAVEEALSRIERSLDRPEVALIGFILRFHDWGGYPLSLDACAVCGKSGAAEGRLSIRRGGWTCGKCAIPEAEGPELSRGALEILRRLRSEGTGKIPKTSSGQVREAFTSIASYLSHTLEHELPTVGYFLRVIESS